MSVENDTQETLFSWSLDGQSPVKHRALVDEMAQVLLEAEAQVEGLSAYSTRFYPRSIRDLSATALRSDQVRALGSPGICTRPSAWSTTPLMIS